MLFDLSPYVPFPVFVVIALLATGLLAVWGVDR